MCLNRAATETEKRNEFRVQTDLKGRRIGFKILTNSGKLPFQGMEDKLPESQWINEKRYRYDSNKKSLPFIEYLAGWRALPAGFKPKRYATGFHIFIDKNEAIQYSKIHQFDLVGDSRGLTVRKVYFRKVVARGYQANSRDEHRVIVCKEIYFAK